MFDVRCLKHAFQPAELTLFRVTPSFTTLISAEQKAEGNCFLSPMCAKTLRCGTAWRALLTMEWLFYSGCIIQSSLMPQFVLRALTMLRFEVPNSLAAHRPNKQATNEGNSLILWGGFIKTLRHKEHYVLVLGCVCPAFSGGYKLGL